MQKTTTTNAPEVSVDTPVSVRIGSDRYASKVYAVTACTVTVERSGEQITFRPVRNAWRSGPYTLVLGESETVLDPCF